MRGAARDQANELELKVVLTTLSLPGARYRQVNGDKPDFRLWHDPQYLPQAALFWKQLAQRLRNHPAIVGYNILNEPVPERATGVRDAQTEDLLAWYAKVENTPADLNRFNAEIVAAIGSNRLFVGEFGCNRMIGGAADYLSDLIRIFNQNDWHWAFFTFRQDSWDGMDYEIGTRPPGAAYWQTIERGETPQPKREDNPLWDVFKRELKK